MQEPFLFLHTTADGLILSSVSSGYFLELEAESTDLAAGFVFVLAIFFGGFELSFLRLSPGS